MILLFIVTHILGIFHTSICGITPKNIVIHISNIWGEIESSNFKVHISAHNRGKLRLSTELQLCISCL